MKSCKKSMMLLLFCIIALACFFRPMQTYAAAGSVTAYQKFTWGISTGLYHVNDIPALCAEYQKTSPPPGTVIESIVPCENDVMRKALYYGYNGPSNMLGSDARSCVLTSVAVSDANIGESATAVSSKYDTFYWDIVNTPSNYPTPPNNFKVFLAIPSNQNMQKLAFYEMEKNGYVNGKKYSSNSEVTDGNQNYSLEGAEYGIYSDASASETSREGTLKTDVSGNTNVIELIPGTYYAREVKAPRGYKISTEIVSFQVTSNQTITLEFTDDPQMGKLHLLVKKVDAETGSATPQGLASLQGAQFTVKYYRGLWEDGIDPSSLHVTPEKTWVFQTDENGEVYMKQKYLVSGNEITESVSLGTITIQETKASKGYQLNPEIFVRKITESGIEEVIVREEKIPPYTLVVHKTDSYKNQLEGAEFALYLDEKCEKEVAKGITGSDGILRFDNLEVEQIYYLKELKAPAGYEKTEDSKNLYPIFLLSSPEENEHHLTIENDVVINLPKTGSVSNITIPAIGAVLCLIGIILSIKEKEKRI